MGLKLIFSFKTKGVNMNGGVVQQIARSYNNIVHN